LSHVWKVTLGTEIGEKRGRQKEAFGRGKPPIIDSCDNSDRCRVQLPAAPALCRGRRKVRFTLLQGRTFRLPPLTFICLDWLGVAKDAWRADATAPCMALIVSNEF
jgi:hypothetical protein